MEIGLAAGLGWFAIVFSNPSDCALDYGTFRAPPHKPDGFSLRNNWCSIERCAPVFMFRQIVSFERNVDIFSIGRPSGVRWTAYALSSFLLFHRSFTSLQTIILLNEQANAALPIIRLRQRFSSRRFLVQRLATMTRNGFLVEGRNGYCLTAKGRRVASTFLFVKRLWHLGAGG